MQQNLMQQGVELMIFGMSTVCVFLLMLIVMTTIMSALIQRFVKPAVPVIPARAVKPPQEDNEQLVAVISAAIHKYRSRQK